LLSPDKASYEDANDAARLACDPVHKLLVGRDPIDGEDLASQPTLSRFENPPDRKELLRMTEALADGVIERHRKRLHGRARRITARPLDSWPITSELPVNRPQCA
jgi:Transposase DDE domain group 1